MGSTPLWSKKRLSSMATTALRRSSSIWFGLTRMRASGERSVAILTHWPFLPLAQMPPSCASSGSWYWSSLGRSWAIAVTKPKKAETSASRKSRNATTISRSQRRRRRRGLRASGGVGGGGVKRNRSVCSRLSGFRRPMGTGPLDGRTPHGTARGPTAARVSSRRSYAGRPSPAPPQRRRRAALARGAGAPRGRGAGREPAAAGQARARSDGRLGHPGLERRPVEAARLPGRRAPAGADRRRLHRPRRRPQRALQDAADADARADRREREGLPRAVRAHHPPRFRAPRAAPQLRVAGRPRHGRAAGARRALHARAHARARRLRQALRGQRADLAAGAACIRCFRGGTP